MYSIILYIFYILYLYIYIYTHTHTHIYIYMQVVISDPRHTECSNLTKARWA